ncbi:MAG: hypothetical protein NT069_24175 [Planctomycetota bacterium]|nr:hypothetical protein [Planctomycetota bacterium]
MKEIIERGATSVVLHVFLPDASSNSGQGRTGLNPTSANLAIAVIRPGDATPVVYSSATSTIDPIANVGTYVAPPAGRCRLREIDPTTLPGWYELQFADALFDTSGDRRSLGGMLYGAASLVPTPFQIQLCDPLRGVGSPSRLDATIGSRAAGVDYTPARAARLDLVDVAVSTRGDATSANQATLLARLGAFTGIGLNTVLGFLRALMRKDPALTPSDVGGTFDSATDSLEARADAAIVASLSSTERVAVADTLLDRIDGIEPGESPRQTLRLLRAVCIGKSAGFPNGPFTFRDKADGKNRVTATVDATGNRTTVVTDAE